MHSILAARSDFSLGESTLSTERLVDLAVAAGQKAVAITDTMSVTGMIDLTTRCKKAGIKPVIGARIRLSDDPAWRPAKGEKKKNMPVHYLTVYVLTEGGLKALYKMLTLANDDAHFYYNAKLSYAEFLGFMQTGGLDDLAVNFGDIDTVLLRDDGLDYMKAIALHIGWENVYAAILPIDTPLFTTINKRILEAQAAGAQPLVVRPAFYEKDGADAHEVLTAIAANRKVSDGYHRSTFNRDFCVIDSAGLAAEAVKSAKRLNERGVTAGPAIQKGIANTKALVDRVTFEWKKQDPSLPVMAPDEFAAVKEACKLGWSERFDQPVFGHQPTKLELARDYMPRLKYELEVLERLKFSGYFLLVQDVVQFAKKNGILVGPGRGSVGGSLVAYLMGITDCDPIRFGLLFERFINPERIDLPDADLDFMSARRHEVIEYLVNKYGEKRVAGVSNYGRLAASSSIRDVGRVLGLSERDYACSKLVPKKHGQPVKLAEAQEQVSEISDFASKFQAHWEIMTRLEGNMRNLSQHAAGVVVGGIDLQERAVVEHRPDTKVVCWDKRIVEDQGLIKMDILGLSTLDLIKLVQDYIFERRAKKIDLARIPLDDPKVLENFAKGNTTGIFQFESSGMRRLLKDLGASGSITFDDITACTALYRPGPMESGMMDSFAQRKQGYETIEYDHKLMEPVLEETFGVMVYQEQVMKVSQVIAGYSGAGADKLRKIMGKKLPEEMKKERGKFVEGCVATVGCTEEWAGELFDKIEGFAGYGFNKSHSVEYTLISYQAMWLKTNYPVEFYAAALSLMDQDKLPALIRDAGKIGVEVSMPDINISTDRFEIATDTRLVMPLTAIKGIASTTTNAVIEARKAGTFNDKKDFLDRVDKRKCNVKHQDLLDRVGAFARIESGQTAANHPDRLVDQIDLLPGLVDAHVPINHTLNRDKLTKEAIAEVIEDYRVKHGPTGGDNDGMPVKPYFGRNAQLMIVQDCPGNEDDGNGVMGMSRSVECVKAAMDEVGLNPVETYWTALVKRPKADKQISPEEIKTYLPYFLEEVRLLAPPVIVLLGSGSVRHFFPDLKGKAFDHAGSVFYSKDHDANFVIGFNPGEIYFSPEKQETLVEVLAKAGAILPC